MDVWVPLVAAVLGGSALTAIVVAIANRRKTRAESEHIEATAEKTDAETTEIITTSAGHMMGRLEGFIDRLENENEALRKEIVEMRIENAKLRDEIHIMREQNENLKNEVADLGKQVSILQISLEKMNLRMNGGDPDDDSTETPTS